MTDQDLFAGHEHMVPDFSQVREPLLWGLHLLAVLALAKRDHISPLTAYLADLNKIYPVGAAVRYRHSSDAGGRRRTGVIASPWACLSSIPIVRIAGELSYVPIQYIEAATIRIEDLPASEQAEIRAIIDKMEVHVDL